MHCLCQPFCHAVFIMLPDYTGRKAFQCFTGIGGCIGFIARFKHRNIIFRVPENHQPIRADHFLNAQ